MNKEKEKKDGFYKKHKQEYADKIVEYSSSPSGKAYIGIAKLPLMKNEGGFGFQGIVLQNDDRTLVQCSSCGEWRKVITLLHLQKCGFEDQFEYKEKYGLNKTEGLVSDETSLRLTENALKNKSGNNFGGKGGARDRRRGAYTKRTRQMENRTGTCPDQIKQRVYDFIRCNRELPTQRNRGRSLYKILARRFETFGKGLKAIGLPKLERQGTNMKYTFPDHTIYQYNINKMYDREALFKMMMTKCPVLTETT